MANQPMYLSYSADCSAVPYSKEQIEAAKLIRYDSGFITGYTENFTPQVVHIVSWSTGTDLEIASMVEAADAGLIDLSEYWSIGDSRKVILKTIPASSTNDYGTWSVSETQDEQSILLVIMDTNHYNLVSDSTKTCNMVVGTKNVLLNLGYMNSSQTNSGSWDGSKRRAWCNAGFRGALPSSLIPIFKQFYSKTANTYNSDVVKSSPDYFSLFAEKEVFGTKSHSRAGEANVLSQINYYATYANRKKYLGDFSSTAQYWWLRSPRAGYSTHFCCVSNSASATYGTANNTSTVGLSPFGCI